MPYPAAVGFEFIFRKLSYRFVKFPEDSHLVIGQRSGDWYRIGYMVSHKVDFDLQAVNESSHLNQSLNLWFFLIRAVKHFLI